MGRPICLAMKAAVQLPKPPHGIAKLTFSVFCFYVSIHTTNDQSFLSVLGASLVEKEKVKDTNESIQGHRSGGNCKSKRRSGS